MFNIRGDLHGHSDYSDGKLSIEESIVKALSLGYEYVAITDHSQSLKVANGLSVARLYEKIEEIKRLRLLYPGITILTGVEVDILVNGELDYPSDILHELDVVIASIHFSHNDELKNMTARLVDACESGCVDIIGHPTCRLPERERDLFFNMNVIAQAAADNDVALEINCNRPRIDLKVEDIIRAKRFNVKFVINTDFHTVAHLDLMADGVRAAKSAGLSRNDVVNCLSFAELKKWLKK